MELSRGRAYGSMELLRVSWGGEGGLMRKRMERLPWLREGSAVMKSVMV